MAKVTTLEIEELIGPEIEQMQVELVDVIYRFENKAQMLRLFIDRENGVDLSLCTDVTKVVKKILDDKDIHYDNLEVSSPGLDRLIKKHQDPQRFIGMQVKVRTLKSFTGPKNIVGELKEADSEKIIVENSNGSYNIPWDVISFLRLHPDFI